MRNLHRFLALGVLALMSSSTSVFADMYAQIFKETPGYTQNTTPMSTMYVQASEMCVYNCRDNIYCRAAVFDTLTYLCALHDTQTNTPTPSPTSYRVVKQNVWVKRYGNRTLSAASHLLEQDGTITLAQCEERCLYRRECNSYTYSLPTSRCFLYTDEGGPLIANPYVTCGKKTAINY